MRAFRNVNLNLALLSFPVSVAKATGTSDLTAKTVGPQGESLRQVYLNDQGKEIDREVTKREIDGRIVTQEELAEINEQCKLTDLDILEVCPVDKIDRRRTQGAYYVYTNKKHGNAKAFKVFVEALKKMKGAAIVKWTPSSRQQLLALYPDGDALVGIAVCFDEDWREADEDVLAHANEKVTAKEVDLAVQLLSTVKGEGEVLATAEDEALPLKRALLEGREPAEVPTSEAKPASDDLTASLEAALKSVTEKQAA